MRSIVSIVLGLVVTMPVLARAENNCGMTNARWLTQYEVFAKGVLHICWKQHGHD
jgi:hypothetical protein